MQFYLDEDLSNEIARIARARGVDVVSCHELGLRRLGDELQLRLAAEQGRCLVTRDRDHFLELTVRFFERQWPHAGVLVVPASVPSGHSTVIAAALVEYDRMHPDGIPAYLVDFLHPASLG